jgi:hypothetical protein
MPLFFGLNEQPCLNQVGVLSLIKITTTGTNGVSFIKDGVSRPRTPEAVNSTNVQTCCEYGLKSCMVIDLQPP